MRHTLSRLLPYAPQQLLELVGDVEAYPQFVPWVTDMRVWNRRDEGGGVTSLDAEAAVGFSFLRERFATHVRRDSGAAQIDVNLIHGPFRYLTNRWKFSHHLSGSIAVFEIDFVLKSRMLDAVLAANFHRAVERLLACFEERAKTLYG